MKQNMIKSSGLQNSGDPNIVPPSAFRNSALPLGGAEFGEVTLPGAAHRGRD